MTKRLTLKTRIVLERVACPLLALLGTSMSIPGEAEDRVGFREDFSSADGWEIGTWPGITGLASITSNGQQTTFATLNGTFLTGTTAAWAPNWPDWHRNAAAGLAMISKKYPGTVDLDRYHFLVARMTFSGTYMALAVNGWDTKVCYTTGLHSTDLRDVPQPSLRGKQPVQLRLTFLNTEGRVVMDEVRLVDELTPEEQAGFMPAGLNLRLERREPKPYHGLEALDARAGVPVRFDFPEERTIFRDSATGATVWKMTRSVRTEVCDSFSPDGSAFPIYHRSFKGMVVYDFMRGGMRELPNLRGSPQFSRADPSVLYLQQSSEIDSTRARYVIQAANFRTGETQTVADWESTDEGGGEFLLSPYSDLLLLGLKEGRALFLIDPRVKEANARVRRVPLPMRMKGASLSHNDQRLNWQRCYYFQRWQMDIATGRIELGAYPTYGGHEIFGRDTIVGRYGTMMLSHKPGVLPLDEGRASEVRIWSNWATPVPSDYGQLSADDRWLVTNGTEGALAGKRLLIDGNETGTVLQIVHDFTSRNSWDSNTYSRLSPDATKIAYMCDMFGDTDVYIAIARRPEAPHNLRLTREGAQVHLRWQPPVAAREVAGYNIYRSQESGRGYRRVNRERIAGTEFVDTPPPSAVFYAVAAEEHSGLEGLYSQEVCTGAQLSSPVRGAAASRTARRSDKATRFRIYADVEEGALAPPLRQHFDGACSNFRCARVWKETPKEAMGAAEVEVSIPSPARYVLWVRAKGEGAFECKAGRESTPGHIISKEWSWVRAERPLNLPVGKQPVTLTSDSDGLSFDLMLLTNSADDRPVQPDDRDPTPVPVEGLHITEATATQVRLGWTPAREPDLDYYTVYVGNQPDFTPGNESILTSGAKAEFLDWGFKPGSTLYYKVVAVNKRGRSSVPATICAAIPALETEAVELKIADATLSGGLARGESKGVQFAWLPAPVAPDAPRPKATWQFSAPLDGTYYPWARYTTVDAKNVSMFWVEADGNQRINGQNWRLRFPCTLTRHLDGIKPGEETWFSDKMMSAWWAGPFDYVALARGQHTLSVGFDPKHSPNGPRLSAVFLSNDPSYRPPGFDPRVDFRK